MSINEKTKISLGLLATFMGISITLASGFIYSINTMASREYVKEAIELRLDAILVRIDALKASIDDLKKDFKK